MRTLLLLVSASLLLLTLASCDDNQAVRQAYQKGAADAIQEVQARVGQSKQQLMGELQPTLLIGAIIVLLLAFFGDVIVEKFREQLVKELALTPERQAAWLSGGYLLICAVMTIWSLARCGTAWSFPVLLLLVGATGVFFSAYLPTLFQSAKEPRRLALSRIKLLMFAACVILAVHELLAADGILRLPL